MKKFICTVCGYIHEGDAAPEKCPLCKAPASKFNEMVETEGGLEFADQHVIGVAKGCDEEMIKDLNNHFMGECTEVGMYLAMSRQADREGYPEIAEAFKRYAWEEAEHASKFAELLGDCVWDTKTNLEKRMNAETEKYQIPVDDIYLEERHHKKYRIYFCFAARNIPISRVNIIQNFTPGQHWLVRHNFHKQFLLQFSHALV